MSRFLHGHHIPRPSVGTGNSPIAAMMTFDVFHAPARDGTFELSINESPSLRFPSRGAALGYAVKLAVQRQRQGLDYAINIEGGDGKWRLLDGWRLCA